MLCVRRAAGYGIFALLDMHQDTFSAKYCGEGVPDWAVYAGSEWLTHIYVLSIFEHPKALIHPRSGKMCYCILFVQLLGDSHTHFKRTRSQSTLKLAILTER